MTFLKPIIFICLFFGILSPFCDAETYFYLEKKASGTQAVSAEVQKGKDIRLLTQKKDVTMCYRLDWSLQTLEWEVNDLETETSLTVRRVGNEIKIDGTKNHLPFHQTTQIDSSPWVQAFVIGFQNFLASSESQTTFWAVRPTDMSVHKLVAIKQGAEEIVIDGEKIKAHKLKMTLEGWQSAFWQNWYWFDADGILLKYRDKQPASQITRVFSKK